MDTKAYKIIMSLQDRDGFIVGGVTYQALKGARLLMLTTEYPTITLNAQTNADSRPATQIKTTDNFLGRFGPAGYSAYDRPTLSLTCYLPIRTDTDTQANLFGTSSTAYTSQSEVALDYYTLFNLWMLNHKLYLSDVKYSLLHNYTSLGLPINIMKFRNDWFNQAILGSTSSGTTITNSTSLTIGTGDKTFTSAHGLTYVVGERVRVYSTANTTNWMEGLVKSYSDITDILVITMDLTNGSGTLTDWKLITIPAGLPVIIKQISIKGTVMDFTNPQSETDLLQVQIDMVVD